MLLSGVLWAQDVDCCGKKNHSPAKYIERQGHVQRFGCSSCFSLSINGPRISTILAQTHFLIFEARLASTFCFLPDKIAYSKGHDGSCSSCSIVQMPTKSDTLVLGLSLSLNHLNRYIFTSTIWASHLLYLPLIYLLRFLVKFHLSHCIVHQQHMIIIT